MLVALTVLTIDRVHSLLHLLHILSSTGIHGVLHDRLLGTPLPPEGTLQGHICSKQRIDKGIVEFLTWPVLDRLLLNLPPCAIGSKSLSLVNLMPTAADWHCW
jgi:hypothetical protein